MSETLFIDADNDAKLQELFLCDENRISRQLVSGFLGGLFR